MKVRTWILALGVALSIPACSLLTFTPVRDAPNDLRAPVAPPVLDPDGGTVAIGQTVQITCATAGAEIHYTVDGASADVTEADPAYTGPVSLLTAGSTTIRVRTYKTGRTASDTVAVDFTVSADVVAMPQFSPASGAVPTGQEITINCATGGADIRYTMDGTDPSDASTLYSDTAKPAIAAAVNMKAKAYKSGMSPSSIATTSYTLTTNPTVQTPSFSPPAGPIAVGGTVQIVCGTSGASINYTTDGTTDPTEASALYVDTARPAIAQNTTLKAKAFKTGMDPSGTASANYSVSVAAPVFNPAPPAILAYGAQIQILCDTAGAAIFLTTDGSEPTITSTPYNDIARPVLAAATTTLKAKAFMTGLNPSVTASATYTATWSAPSAPALSAPTDQITAQDPTSINFYWAASTDPDPGDSVTYRLFVDIVNPPVRERTTVAIAGTTFSVGGLVNSATYYWRVMAYDLHGFSTPSVVRSFTTRPVTVMTVGDLGWAVASLWTGTSRENVGTGTTHAYAIALSGGTVYVSGGENVSGTLKPAYWSKSGASWSSATYLDLPGGALSPNAAYGVTLDGSTICTAGFVYPDPLHFEARIWRGTAATPLAYRSGSIASFAAGLAVSGTTTYVVGESVDASSNHYACYWTVESGAPTQHDLTATAGSPYGAYGVAVSGSDVYFVGADGGNACYWKKDTPTPYWLYRSGTTKFAGTATAITISGGKIYIAGYSGAASDNSLWVVDSGTTTRTSLSLPTGTFVDTDAFTGHSIAVAPDGTVYIPGRLKSSTGNYEAYYWAGPATPVFLGSSTNSDTMAWGIAIVP